MRPEDTLRVLVLGLVTFGIVMVYSSSSFAATLRGENSIGFAARQAVFALIGVGAYWVGTRINLRAAQRLANAMMVAATVMLVAVLIPGVGMEINGSRRWFSLGVTQLQPAEFAKIALIMWIAAGVARNPRIVRTPRGLVPYVGATVLFSLLIVVEPDLGTASMLFLVSLAMLYVAGAHGPHVAGIAGAVIGAALVVTSMSPYHQQRMMAFIDPWGDAEGKGFQLIQALVAVGTGGLHGVGLGQGQQKAFYIPEAHNDMILATIAEELGFLGVAGLLVVLGLVILLAFRIALTAPTVFQRLIAVGLTALIAGQALDNMLSTLGWAPITGVPLPFVSYGGSSLIMLLFSVGILVNIGRNAKTTTTSAPAQRRDDPGDDRGQWDGRSRGAGAGSGRSAARAWG